MKAQINKFTKLDLINRLDDTELEKYRRCINKYEEDMEKEGTLKRKAKFIFNVIFNVSVFILVLVVITIYVWCLFQSYNDIQLFKLILRYIFISATILYVAFKFEDMITSFFFSCLCKKDMYIPRTLIDRDFYDCYKQRVQDENLLRMYEDSSKYVILKKEYIIQELDSNIYELHIKHIIAEVNNGDVADFKLILPIKELKFNREIRIPVYDMNTGMARIPINQCENAE